MLKLLVLAVAVSCISACATPPAYDADGCPWGHESECEQIRFNIVSKNLAVKNARKQLEIDYQFAGDNPDAFHKAKIAEDTAKLNAAIARP